MAEKKSKELLKLEGGATAVSASSCLESKLFVCKKEKRPPFPPFQNPTAALPLPKSQVLGKVKDFLGVISESNKKLLHDAKENPDNYDIEVLSGKESEYIEMDLMLGVADLHTPEAVAAAESAMVGHHPPAIPSSDNSSESDNEDSSDEDDDDKKEDRVDEQDVENDSENVKLGSKDDEREGKSNGSRKHRPKKKPKIIELS